jgi:hypothetical protein
MNPYTTPFNDSRQHGIVIGDLNNANNKIIKIEDDLKKFRSKAQLQGDQDRRDTGKARQHIKKKRSDAIAVGEVFNTLPEQRVMKQVFGLWKQYKDENKYIIDNTSSSIYRPHTPTYNYFNMSDNIDVSTTTPILKDYSGEDENEADEENIESPYIESPYVDPVPSKSKSSKSPKEPKTPKKGGMMTRFRTHSNPIQKTPSSAQKVIDWQSMENSTDWQRMQAQAKLASKNKK